MSLKHYLSGWGIDNIEYVPTCMYCSCELFPIPGYAYMYIYIIYGWGKCLQEIVLVCCTIFPYTNVYFANFSNFPSGITTYIYTAVHHPVFCSDDHSQQDWSIKDAVV